MKTEAEINHKIDELCYELWKTRTHGGFKGTRYAQLDVLYWLTGVERMTVREVEKRGSDVFIARKKQGELALLPKQRVM